MTAATTPATATATVGDIVHYWDSWRGELTPHAAMVIALKDDCCVKLLVTNPNGNQFVAPAQMWSATPRKAFWSFRS